MLTKHTNRLYKIHVGSSVYPITRRQFYLLEKLDITTEDEVGNLSLKSKSNLGGNKLEDLFGILLAPYLQPL